MRNFYLNHDGNIDDFVSLLMLLKMPDINLIGVGVTDGDGYVNPSVNASIKIIEKFGDKNRCPIDVAKSNSRAKHPFPDGWRVGSYSFADFPILNEHEIKDTSIAELPAHLDLIAKIKNATSPVTLVMTGPLTDLARAIEIDSTFIKNVDHLYWMGGSLNGHGNVADRDLDSSMEWNAYWDAEAVKTVLESPIKMVMVGLDSTDQVPLTSTLRKRWAKQRYLEVMDLIGQGYALIQSEPNSDYYLWDVLTTLFSNYPELGHTKTVKIDVATTGVNEGQTFISDSGHEITFVTECFPEAFYQKMDELAAK